MLKNLPLFFQIVDGRLILWDYLRHNQFEFPIDHLERLIEICNGSTPNESAIDLDLVASGILEPTELGPTPWGWDRLSHIFHFGTQVKFSRDVDEALLNMTYPEYCQEAAQRKSVESSSRNPAIALPEPRPLPPQNLEIALMRRCTSRQFDEDKASISSVADTLYWVFGAVHGDTRSDIESFGFKSSGYRRTSPCGGGLQSTDAYLVALNVDGLPNGIYSYDSKTHMISCIETATSRDELVRLLAGQETVRNIAYGIFLVARFNNVWWKYPHSRAYRVVHIDIGCLAQTFQLVTQALDLRSWMSGIFLDSEVNALLMLDQTSESTLFFLGAGPGGTCPIAPEILNKIEAPNH